MAQKAAKTLAARNTSLLRRTHLISLTLHLLYLLLHFLFNRPRSLLTYILLTSPTLLIQLYLEKLGRPRYTPDGNLKSAGEDLDARGLTEYLWDVTYWTWGCMVLACVFGDKAWWVMVVVPGYSVWLAYKTFMGVRQGGIPGMGMGEMGVGGEGGGESKRQKKMEKRGGQQRVKYR